MRLGGHSTFKPQYLVSIFHLCCCDKGDKKVVEAKGLAQLTDHWWWKSVWNLKLLVTLHPQLGAVEQELIACMFACAPPLSKLIQFRNQTKGMASRTVRWVSHIS